MRRLALIAGICVLLGVAVADTAAGRTGLPRVAAVSQKIFGHSYREWNVDWARFEYSGTAASSPLLAPAGCRHKVEGKMFLLPGPAKGQLLTCTIPRGDAVFIPTASGLALRTGPKDTRSALRGQAQSTFTQTKILDVTIDGSKFNARPYAVTTDLFALDAQKGNIMGVTVGSHLAIQSGYNLILEPLPTGSHTIKLHVKIAAGGKTLYEARTTFKLNAA